MRRAVAICAAVAVALVLAGRWQAGRDIDAQLRGIDGSFRAAARRPVPEAWRLTGELRCLLYPSGPTVMAYELCFDPDGRLVEAVDRRDGGRRIYSLRFEPGKADIRVDSGALDRVLTEMDAYAPYAPHESAVRPVLFFVPSPKPPRIPAGSGLPGAAP